MKTSTILFTLLSIASAAELVVRQDTANSTITSAPATATLDNSPQALCLSACDPTDVNCRAQCVGGAHPNSAQVNQTNECIVACPAGDGSAAQTDQYNSCVRGCINSYYLSGQSVGIITPGSVTATGTPSVSASTTGSSVSQSTGSPQSSGGTQSTGKSQSTGEFWISLGQDCMK